MKNNLYNEILHLVKEYNNFEEFKVIEKKEIKPGENIIAVTGSKVNPEIKTYGEGGGRLGDGIYFTTDIDKAKSYGEVYITILKIDKPLYADKDYSRKEMERIFGKGKLEDVFFGSDVKNGREIAENISHSKNRKLLFSILTSNFDSVMYKDGFEICYFKTFKTFLLKDFFKK